MQLKTAVALLAAASPAVALYDVSIPQPVCAKFKDINVKGVGEFVNTDGSGGQPVTTGDMSISFNLSGKFGPNFPNQPHFRNISLDLNAVCVTKRDQGIINSNGVPQGNFDAPVCFYEGELGFCRSLFILSDFVAVERVPASRVSNPEDFFVFNGRRLERREDAPDAGSDAEAGNLRRDLQQDSLFGGKGDNTVQAVKITEEIRKDNDPDILDVVCPRSERGPCYVPFPPPCIDQRKGGFTAHGTGSQNIKITGGTGDLFGAFGQILTPDSGIDITSVDPFTGDITYNFDAGIEICYYRREDNGFF